MDNLYCHFSYHMGQDWSVISGQEEGLTQVGQRGGHRQNVVWNFPIDLSLKSTNVFGWPQIVLAVYGLDGFGRDVIRGYGSMHLPTSTGRHELHIRLFVPQSASPLQRLTAWVGASQAEFVDPKLPAKHAGREGLFGLLFSADLSLIGPEIVVRVVSGGSVTILLNVVSKDMALAGYAVGSAAPAPAGAAPAM
jgi:B9 domain-containing protein 1